MVSHTPYAMAVPHKMIIVLGDQHENALEKKPTVAITMLLSSNECVALYVYKVTVRVHPFPQLITSH